jgi:hypothetical protein
MGIFTLARRMGTSVRMIDATYGHLVRDADDQDRDLLDAYDARRARSGHDRDEPAGWRAPQERQKPRRSRASVGTGATGLEPATSGVTGRRSNQLSYAPGRQRAPVWHA